MSKQAEKSTITSPVKTQSSKEASGSSNGDRSNLEQIKDLLYGPELQSQLALIKQTESQLSLAIDTLSKRVDDLFSQQDKKLETMFAKLEATLEKEQKQRNDDTKSIQQAMDTARKETHVLVQEASAESGSAEEKLANEIAQLESTMEYRFKELGDKLNQSEASLDDNKADRTMLADLLQSVAKQIEKGKS